MIRKYLYSSNYFVLNNSSEIKEIRENIYFSQLYLIYDTSLNKFRLDFITPTRSPDTYFKFKCKNKYKLIIFEQNKPGKSVIISHKGIVLARLAAIQAFCYAEDIRLIFGNDLYYATSEFLHDKEYNEWEICMNRVG